MAGAVQVFYPFPPAPINPLRTAILYLHGQSSLMKRYQDTSGHSGVFAYEIADDAITVTFKDGGTYLYSYARPGAKDVEAMKALAVRGAGLATYINTHVRKAYARKISG
jgi:hypothetical protein